MINLQGVGEELVHLGDAGGNAEVDGSVANLNDETTNDLGVDLAKGCLSVTRGIDFRSSKMERSMTHSVGDLELLALADVGGLGDGALKSVEGSVVQRLQT